MYRDRLIDQFTKEQRGDEWIIGQKLQLRKKVIKYSPNMPKDEEANEDVAYYDYEDQSVDNDDDIETED